MAMRKPTAIEHRVSSLSARATGVSPFAVAAFTSAPASNRVIKHATLLVTAAR